jgi:hypothetical protein
MVSVTTVSCPDQKSIEVTPYVRNKGSNVPPQTPPYKGVNMKITERVR